MNARITAALSALVLALSVLLSLSTSAAPSNLPVQRPAVSAAQFKGLPAICKSAWFAPSRTVKINSHESAHVWSGKRLVSLAVKSSAGNRSDLISQCEQLIFAYASDLEAMNR